MNAPVDPNRLNRVLTILLRAVLVLVVVSFVVLAFFAHPSTDDYCYARQVFNRGFLGAQAYWFNNFGGRYFGQALISLYALVTRPFDAFFSAYKLVPLLTMTALACALLGLLKSLTAGSVSNAELRWGALTLFVLYVTRMPTTAQGLFWLNGVCIYMVGLILGLFLLSMLLRSSSLASPFLRAAGCCLLVVCLIGDHEIIAMTFLPMLVVGVVVTTLKKHSAASLWRAALVTGVVCALPVFFAPGNFARAAEPGYEHRFDLLRGSVFGLVGTIESIVTWALDPALLGASLLTIPLVASLSGRVPILTGMSRRGLLGFVVLAVALIASVFGFMNLLTGESGIPHRIQNVPFLIFLLSWFAGIAFWTAIRQRESRPVIVPDWALVAAKVVVIVSLLIQGHTIAALKDCATKAPRYHAQLQERYQVIRAAIARGEKHIVVSALVNPPPTIYKGAPLETGLIFRRNKTYKGDFTDDPANWRNVCTAEFWGIESIRTDAADASSPDMDGKEER